MRNVDNYTINFDSEERTKLKLKYMVEHHQNLFQLIVMDDNDETYIPNFQFNYKICDCSKKNLCNKKVWDRLINSNFPIVFINTSDLFKQFENYELFGIKFDSGSGAFSQMFYFMYRDTLWNESNAKLIFLVSEENAYLMNSAVNAGFSTMLQPFYMRKDANKANGEKIYQKTFKKVE